MNKAIGLILFLLSFGIYLITLSPSIYPEDSAELTAVIYNSGIAHSPGYPLYTICGKLLCSIVPFGNISYRTNIYSSLFAGGSVLLIYYILLLIIENPFPSAITAMCSAFSYVLWYSSAITEVYTMYCFFCLLLIYITLYWYRKTNCEKTNLLFLFGFTTGLSLVTHYLVMGILPFLFLFILFNLPKKELNFKNVSYAVFTLLLGLTPFIFLILRSIRNPIIDGGNPETIRNFLRMVSRQDYGGVKMTGGTGFSAPVNMIFDTFVWCINAFKEHYTLPVYILGVLGIITGIMDKKVNRKLFWLCFFLLLFSGPVLLILVSS
ncbi:MAG: DUF2723 domain-containing protein, partial [Ignavibacteria bacterium]|nr:DUF2723 domain-containing protein [Ignavibacteria bacterium]